MLRRGLALGLALIVLIGLVLGVKGCLDAQAQQALSSYARDVSEIVEETQQTSKAFFGKLSNPGSLSVTEFDAEVNADRSAMDNYVTRVDSLSAPGGMGQAQGALELVYELRGSAMDEIAAKMSTALGNVGSAKATAVIAKQMQKLLASDILYAAVARPEIDAVLENNGIQNSNVPRSTFLPEGTKWLNPATVSSALGQVSGSTAAIDGTELSSTATNSISSEGTPEVEAKVQNQGESTENGIKVSVKVNGGHTLQGEISTIGVGETQTVTIPLTPAPKGQVSIEVNVQPVPGEKVISNNKASYAVNFE
jgi:hypothetical protein